MTTPYQLEDLPMYAPHSLNVHMVEGVSYGQARQCVERLGILTILPRDWIWYRLSILQIRIPSGDLDEWIAKLHCETIVSRVTKVPSRFPSTSQKQRYVY